MRSKSPSTKKEKDEEVELDYSDKDTNSLTTKSATKSFTRSVENVIEGIRIVYYKAAEGFDKIPRPFNWIIVVIVAKLIEIQITRLWEDMRIQGFDLPPVEQLLGFQSKTPVSDLTSLTFEQVFLIFIALYLFDTFTVQMGKNLLERDVKRLEKRVAELEKKLQGEEEE